MEPEGGFIAISRFGKQGRGVDWGDLLVALVIVISGVKIWDTHLFDCGVVLVLT
ncbi:hypothetical protein [Aeromonas allosaccharophila]|uniref:Uncharacterized protein n=1 Tax=Aeromonas allosaccharophila TaxID=656 RepID=A0AAX3P0G7_9GAMM|nr:hypothetical protein [Aeromonas allosaccharophila]WED77888.1 hypothetical protein PYU98_06590 [Aeromonas allosaccharophila]